MAIKYYNQLEEPLYERHVKRQAEGKSSTSLIRSLSTGSRYHLPASCFFDWRDFSIFIEDKDAHKAGHFSSSSECLETQNDSNHLLSGLSIASKDQDRSSDIKWFSMAKKAKYQWVSRISRISLRPGKFSRATWTTQSGCRKWGRKSSKFGRLSCGTTRTGGNRINRGLPGCSRHLNIEYAFNIF